MNVHAPPLFRWPLLLLLMVVGLFATAQRARAAPLLDLSSPWVVATYNAGNTVPIEACDLAPDTPVVVSCTVDVRLWYWIENHGGISHGYQYAQDLTFDFDTCDGVQTFVLHVQSCGGVLLPGMTHEVTLNASGLELGDFFFVTTAAQVPTGVTIRSAGVMEDWDNLPVVPGTRPRWSLMARNSARVHIQVTPLAPPSG